jgi:hypothetical protein
LTIGSFTIPNGQTSVTETFTIVNDTSREVTETAIFTLSESSTALQLGATTTATLTITDND